MLKNDEPPRAVHGLTECQLAKIKAYIQGAVYCWAKNRKGDHFAARDLFGGENFDWAGTPLHAVYLKHIALGKDDAGAQKEAGHDVGWLLKAVLHEDSRTFESIPDQFVKTYMWIP